MINLDSILQSRDITLLTKVHIVRAIVFPVVTYGWELDYKEDRMPKNWCLQTVLEKPLESLLDSKDIKLVNPKGNQPWIFTGRTDAESEAPLLWPPDVELTPWKRPWFQERLRAKGEGSEREWDDWMASSTQWTWAWANYGRWWRTGNPGVLQSMQSQTRFSDWTATACWQLIESKFLKKLDTMVIHSSTWQILVELLCEALGWVPGYRWTGQ